MNFYLVAKAWSELAFVITAKTALCQSQFYDFSIQFNFLTIMRLLILFLSKKFHLMEIALFSIFIFQVINHFRQSRRTPPHAHADKPIDLVWRICTIKFCTVVLILGLFSVTNKLASNCLVSRRTKSLAPDFNFVFINVVFSLCHWLTVFLITTMPTGIIRTNPGIFWRPGWHWLADGYLDLVSTRNSGYASKAPYNSNILAYRRGERNMPL